MRHHYLVEISWTGDLGSGTSSYTAYDRDYEVRSPGKPPIPGSSDPIFRGDATRWNPEELLVASVSACHKLWYLHLCADAGVVVTAYEDAAEGVMVHDPEAEGQFERVVLRPRVTISSDGDVALADSLHRSAHEKCFIARSVAFPIVHEAVTVRAAETVGP